MALDRLAVGPVVANTGSDGASKVFSNVLPYWTKDSSTCSRKLGLSLSSRTNLKLAYDGHKM